MTGRPPGRTALLQAARLQGNKEMGAVIERASLDDLEWFVQMLEFQLDETPHWVDDERRLHEIQAWTRRARIMVTESLHDKRLAARKWSWAREIGKDAVLVILGALLGWTLAWFFPSTS